MGCGDGQGFPRSQKSKNDQISEEEPGLVADPLGLTGLMVKRGGWVLAAV